MIEIINSAAATSYLDRYFEAAKKLGYVKPSVTKRFMAYAFLADFVDTLYYFLTEKDYCEIEDAMLNIFSNAGCLLSYSMFCTQKAKIGKPFGSVAFRGTETRSNIRATEDNKLRKV